MPHPGTAKLARLLCAGLLAAFVLSSASAEEGPHPDISGFWNWTPADRDAPGVRKLIDALPEDVILLQDTGPVEFGPGEFGGLDPKPEARAEAKTWTPQDELKPENTCRKPTIIYAMQGPFPMEVFQGEAMIVFKLEYFDMVRVVHMDGRSLPPEDAPHSEEGRSIGHWEGDTLVVETTHLTSGTLTNNGLEHSDLVRVVERFRLSEDGRTLWATQMFEDPETINNRGARLIAWECQPGNYVFPYNCDPFAYVEE